LAGKGHRRAGQRTDLPSRDGAGPSAGAARTPRRPGVRSLVWCCPVAAGQRVRIHSEEPEAGAEPTMSFFTREQCLQRLRAQVAAGKSILGGGAGTGISAKCAEAGGIDLMIIYNSGRFRMAGRGSLSGMMPYGDANQIVVEMAREVLPVVKHIP